MTAGTKCSLVDVNVWIALLMPAHPHHRLAVEWFDGLAPDEACICRSVQLSVVRLLANRSAVGKDAMLAGRAWQIVASLPEDERVKFVDEPRHIETVLRDLLYQKEASGQIVMDAYLAAFAICAGCEFVTLDTGFRKFPAGLDLNLIG